MCLKPALAATALALVWCAQASAAPAATSSATTPVQPQASAAQAAPAAARPAPPPVMPTREQRIEADRLDPLGRAAFWAHVVDLDGRDLEAGVKLAKALRELSRLDEAVAACERVLVIEPANVEALLEEARARIAQNQGFFAIDPAERAAAAAPRDWRAPSLLAIALEQAQRDDEALAQHQKALALAPNNPAAMSNLAMFYAVHGRSAEAEALLRKAAAMPTATAQIRQNLALILGLQGKISEAEQLARRDLPPAEVANNLAYLRAASTPTTDHSWTALQSAP